ncbi:MAG: lipopolysaccharide biosynthesis protein, partial [Phycisphaerales bacterium JB039]
TLFRSAVIVYAWVSALLMIGSVILAAALMVALDRRTAPRPQLASREGARAVLAVGGWNSLTLLASNMHIRLDQLLMNLFLGLKLNAVFTVAVTLGSYARMTTVGVTSGVDAVAARLSARAPGGAVAVLLHHSTRLHALVALPAAAGILLLTGPILHVWLGRRLDPQSMQMAVTLTQLILIGVTARAISDGWFRVLYGAGHIRRYAPLVLAGGLANPVIAIGLLLTLPDPIRYTGPAISYAAIIVSLHFVAAPRIVADVLGLRYREILAPVLRPLAATLIMAPAPVVGRVVISTWTPLSLGAVIFAAGAVYAGAAWLLVVRDHERRRIRAATLGRLGLAH